MKLQVSTGTEIPKNMAMKCSVFRCVAVRNLQMLTDILELLRASRTKKKLSSRLMFDYEMETVILYETSINV
jgi:hypothetical protein